MSTATPPTRTKHAAAARLHVDERGVREARSCVPLALRPLRDEGDGVVRIGLLQSGAMLIDGDDIRLDVSVAPGAALELRDISATLAYPMRAGAAWRLAVDAGEEARVVISEAPLVIATGARVTREVAIALAPGARALHRDTLVLGRHGEAGGAVRARTRITRAAGPVLDDTLDTSVLDIRRSHAVLGAARVVASLTLFGVDAQPEGCALASGDRLLRRLAVSMRETAGVDEVQRRWRAAVLEI